MPATWCHLAWSSLRVRNGYYTVLCLHMFCHYHGQSGGKNTTLKIWKSARNASSNSFLHSRGPFAVILEFALQLREHRRYRQHGGINTVGEAYCTPLLLSTTKEYTRPPLTRWAMSTAAAWQQTIWSVPVWPREKATLTHQSQQWHGRLPFAKESGEAMTPVWDQCTLSMIIHRLYELVPTQFCDVKCNKQAWTVRCRYYSVAVKLADIQLMPLTHDLKFLLAFSQFEQSWNIFRFLKKNFDTCHSGKK